MSRFHNILIALTLTAFSACSDSQLEGWEPYLSTGQQEPVPTTLSVDQTSITVESASTSSVINVTASGQWTASSAADWITLSTTSGTGDASITITIDENKTPDTRTGTVTIQNSASSVKVTLTQNGKTLSVTPESLSFGADGGTETVSVSTDGTFTASTSDNWIAVSSDGNTVTVKVSENMSTSTRLGTVTVSLSNLTSGSLSRTITVSQDGATQQTVQQTFTVNGVSFTMVQVEGGTFTMGATEEQDSDADDDEKPAHQVTLSTYMIGETEVTQELWEAVMGSNPSNLKEAKHPVERVSWNDCQDFIKKLNVATGKTFRLPTEAEWEYAARGGNRCEGYKYAGSNTIGDVAWFRGNSGGVSHEVATKQPNEVGLYDMTGNVWEWCQDWYGSYGSSSQINPQGPESGQGRVLRGGSWGYDARECRSSFRYYLVPGYGDNNLGLRLVLSENRQTFTVNGVSFTMVQVEGGTFTMGTTDEQGNDAYDNEKPAHQVTLSTYSIGETEVTQELWETVMGSNPSYFKGSKRPVEQVSWNDCHDFISKLNAVTRKTFRLPTEAEWEYAARGGNRSRGYKYSGSDTIDEVAWYVANSGDITHDVAQKQPNELGLYDMSGNVYEWCQDWYGDYSSYTQTNPLGPDSGQGRVIRGGCCLSYFGLCRSYYRDLSSPGDGNGIIGLRLVLSN